MAGQYGYLEQFISELRSNGRYAFSLPEVRNQFEQSDEAIKKALQRLKKKKEIALIRNEFYVVITFLCHVKFPCFDNSTRINIMPGYCKPNIKQVSSFAPLI